MTSPYEDYAKAVTAKFSVVAVVAPEDQLKGPVSDLFKAVAGRLGRGVDVVTEVIDSMGRPDMGVAVDRLLCGHVELKKPGKGSNPERLRGADAKQWGRFKVLPNLIYTDGNEWSLFRSGVIAAGPVRIGAGDITKDGAAAVDATGVAQLEKLLKQFLAWSPQVPKSPRELAALLAPLCRLLREQVLDALDNDSGALAALSVDWRQYLFPESSDEQFADAYAQTLSYALLLARFSGGLSLTTVSAATLLRPQHRLLADTLRILSDPAARAEIHTSVDLLERFVNAIDAVALAKRSKGDPWLYFYEDFLAEYDPKLRKDRGVYYTPGEVVQCQVHLIAELLRARFNASDGFADPSVVTLDPAAGTGTYILGAIDHSISDVSARMGRGMASQPQLWLRAICTPSRCLSAHMQWRTLESHSGSWPMAVPCRPTARTSI